MAKDTLKIYIPNRYKKNNGFTISIWYIMLHN